MNTSYDELAERAERGELAVKPSTVRRGTEAAEESRRLLMEAAGVTNSDELMTRVALGRPAGGAPGGASPVVRARVPQPLKARIVEIAEHDHRNESDIVRDALAAYVERRAS